MSVVRPSTASAGSLSGPGWRLTERRNDAPYLTDVLDDGSAAVELPTVPDGRIQVVERTVIGTDSDPASFTPELRLYLGSLGVTDLVDATLRGNLDVAEYPLGLVVPAGSRLVAVWTGAEPGARAWARVQFSTYAYGG